MTLKAHQPIIQKVTERTHNNILSSTGLPELRSLIHDSVIRKRIDRNSIHWEAAMQKPLMTKNKALSYISQKKDFDHPSSLPKPGTRDKDVRK